MEGRKQAGILPDFRNFVVARARAAFIMNRDYELVFQSLEVCQRETDGVLVCVCAVACDDVGGGGCGVLAVFRLRGGEGIPKCRGVFHGFLSYLRKRLSQCLYGRVFHRPADAFQPSRLQAGGVWRIRGQGVCQGRKGQDARMPAFAFPRKTCRIFVFGRG